jgi:hypothetical protein
MQTPNTYPLRFKIRSDTNRVAAIKAVREAVGPANLGLKEAKDGIEAGVLYLRPDQTTLVLGALAPYADIETTNIPMSYEDAVARLRSVCKRLAARVVQRAAESLEQFEQQFGRGA